MAGAHGVAEALLDSSNLILSTFFAGLEIKMNGENE
jgi:hypothetical protein